MKKLVITTFTISLLSGCATPPQQLAAQHVSPLQYENFNCEQVDRSYSDVIQRQDVLEIELQTLAENDALQMTFGMLLFWPTLFFLEGGDGSQATEYTRLKGEAYALKFASIEKKCPDFTINKVEEQVNQSLEKEKPRGKTKRVRCGMYSTCEVEI
ncbi:metal ABC transporter ATP-binding protein [Vibrio bathopelagicus]|uniref:metal ABC transporter ATP-binding protein n=1 Tax=Vibrio bathopelagicus TaxID=2777577 RepID=UPI0018644B72|nr:metal ABC transporter ATP-binding protein [Vibrio bathopelagicus]